MRFLNREVPAWAVEQFGAARIKNEIQAARGSGLNDKLARVIESGRRTDKDLGSVLLYAFGVTTAEPQFDATFYDPSLPDIDADFNDQKRDECYDYLERKYGADCVARVGTISTFKPKSALIEACKALGIPPFESFAVKNALFVRSSGDSRATNCLADTLAETEPGRLFVAKHPAVLMAGDIEGHASHTGKHAAGVCVCNEPIANYCTVVDGIMQLSKYDAEYVNMLKIDVLGLRTLGVIEDAGVVQPETLYTVPKDDPAVYALFNARKYAAIFQWEGQALQTVTNQLHITKFSDLDHVTALARPGPLGGGAVSRYIERHAGREKWSYPHPTMKEYLDESLGLVLYQEQVLRMCREIADMSWSDVTKLQKAMSKSFGKEFFDKFRDKFVAGAARVHGIDGDTAQHMWDEINSMGCLSGDTIVLEQFTIRDFAELNLRREIYSLNIEDKALRPQRCLDAFFSGRKLTSELKLADEKSIRATLNHKFLRADGEWVELGRLKPGDQIATQRIGKRVAFMEVVSIGNQYEEDVYDISMPPPDCNFIANGIVVANSWSFNRSHSVSYATVSYWTAWMKAHYPLEYAAAALRNSQDDAAVLALLRELDAEGVKYVPFDPELSEVNWAVKEGQLVGGWQNLHGVGPAKAVAYVEKRRLGLLTDKDREKIAAAKIKFDNLYPLHAEYKGYYDNPGKFGIDQNHPHARRITELKDLPNEGPVLLLVRVMEKDKRDENELVRLARRGGERVEGNPYFLDLAVVDDSATQITLRIDRWQWEPQGRLLLDRLREGEDVLLVRGQKIPNFPMVKVVRTHFREWVDENGQTRRKYWGPLALKCLTQKDILKQGD